MPETISNQAADLVMSSSFLLTAVSIVIVAIAGAHGLWSNYRAKKIENDTKRLDLWYKLMLCSVGMGDARRRSNDDTSWQTFVPAQIIGIQALSAFPEHRAIYDSLAENMKKRAEQDPNDLNSERTLYAEFSKMMQRLPKS